MACGMRLGYTGVGKQGWGAVFTAPTVPPNSNILPKTAPAQGAWLPSQTGPPAGPLVGTVPVGRAENGGI